MKKAKKPKPADSSDKSCFYDGKQYSGGSTIEMPKAGGKKKVMTCDPEKGRWVEEKGKGEIVVE